MSGESAEVMPITSFEELVESLGIPEACKLDKPVFKKMLLDTEALDGADKTALKDDVEKIRWLYTLKPSTINVAPYSDGDKEYTCLLYTSPSPRDQRGSRMPSSA